MTPIKVYIYEVCANGYEKYVGCHFFTSARAAKSKMTKLTRLFAGVGSAARFETEGL